MMEVEIGKAMGAETPASCMAEFVTEHITALMTLGGIESISAQRYSCGFGSRLHVIMAPFASAPKEVTDQGVIIKDAIAQVLSVANITRVVMKPSEEDMGEMKKTWDMCVRESSLANAGSGQDFSGSSGHYDASSDSAE